MNAENSHMDTMIWHAMSTSKPLCLIKRDIIRLPKSLDSSSTP